MNPDNPLWLMLLPIHLLQYGDLPAKPLAHQAKILSLSLAHRGFIYPLQELFQRIWTSTRGQALFRL
jgi:hypothetical protein